MDALLEHRAIAITILYLKSALHEAGKKRISEEHLADFLNEHLGSHTITHAHLNDLVKVRVWPDAITRHRLLEAMRALARHREVEHGLIGPGWIETQRQFAPNLPEALRDLGNEKSEVGIALGDLAKTLHGAWRFYYVSPVDRDGRNEPEVRGTLCVFRQAAPGNVSAEAIHFSGHTQWRGIAFTNDTHLYIHLSAADQTETAFFVVDKPSRSSPRFVGLGLALQRSRERRSGPPPAMAVLCIGEKLSDQDLRMLTAGDDEDAMTMRRLLNGTGPVDEGLAQVIHKRFTSVRYNDLNELYADHPHLAEDVASVQLNGAPLSMKWLHLTWR